MFDIILFGVTGFTGKLAVEYMMERKNLPSESWAVSGRDRTRTEAVMKEIAARCGCDVAASPVRVLEADLVCTTREQEEALREVVKQAKVVLTCSGPFEKYGQTLVKLCAELGVHYADITGETDFVRQTIVQWDQTAQTTGACLISHCGNDCIPCDLSIFELAQHAKKEGCTLSSVMTYEEFSEDSGFSGGTANTAAFQLSKDRTKPKDPSSFDPLLKMRDGTKSEFVTKNQTPKSDVEVPTLPGRKAGTWVMGPVMVNCVRRSNALLGYSKELAYGDVAVKHESFLAAVKQMSLHSMIGAATIIPGLGKYVLPKPGEGPARDVMEQGYLKLHAVATMKIDDTEGEDRQVVATFQFNKDVGYLYTAALLVETGMLLVEKASSSSLSGGCHTPASALGSDLTQRILKEMDTSFEIKELNN